MSGDRVAWRGDARHPGLTLTQEELATARAVRERAAAAQQTLDSVMGSVQADLDPRHGGSLEGIQYSLKDEDSFLRKIAGRMGEQEVPAAEAIAERAHDLNRYTLTFPVDSYLAGVNDAITKLREQGLVLKSGRDSWNDPVYKGINTTWYHGATDRRVEVQFHTPESFQAKHDTHAVLEVQRAQRFADGRPVDRRHRYAAQCLQAERYRESGQEVVVPSEHEQVEPELIRQPAPRDLSNPPIPEAVAEVQAEAELLRREKVAEARRVELDRGLTVEGSGLQPAQPRGPPGLPEWQRRLVPDRQPGSRDRDRDWRSPEPERGRGGLMR